ASEASFQKVSAYVFSNVKIVLKGRFWCGLFYCSILKASFMTLHRLSSDGQGSRSRTFYALKQTSPVVAPFSRAAGRPCCRPLRFLLAAGLLCRLGAPHSRPNPSQAARGKGRRRAKRRRRCC
ncbi:unnamed protein product, partial [Phaeothamnion confervicola]